MTQRAIIYARFSTATQQQGSSLERQLGNGRKYIEAQEWTLEREIADLGRSAFHGANRAEGSELHQFEAEAREGHHDGKVLCVENLDRLSRQGVKAAATLVWALNSQGVDVATWYDGHIYKAKGDNDLLDVFRMAMDADRANKESVVKSKRGKDAWKTRYEKIEAKKPGTRSGRPPAWLEWDGQAYQPHPVRAAVLNEIFDLYLAGQGAYKIVQLLNEREEPSWPNKEVEDQKGWYLGYVHSLRAVLGEYITLKGKVIATDYYPRVVSIEKFTQVQAIANGRAKVGGRDYRRFNNLLSGLPKCAVCEGTAAYENKGENGGVAHTRKDGSKVVYNRKHYEKLRCDNNRRRKGCSNRTLFDYRVVENALLDQLLGLTTEDERRSTQTQVLDEKILQVVRDLEVAQQRVANIVEAIADGAGRALAAKLTEIEQSIDTLEADRKALVGQREAEASKPTIVDDTQLIAQARADLYSTDQETRLAARTRVNSALRRLVDGLWIDADGTFTILADIAVWQFDNLGKRIGGQAL